MSIPNDLKYTKEHEWIRQEGDELTVGITAFAAGQLGDVVFVELPEEGDTITAGDAFGVVESVKSVSDLYAPISGTVTAINGDLIDAPEQVNDSPYDAGWMLRINADDADELEGLMSADDYQQFIKVLEAG